MHVTAFDFPYVAGFDFLLFLIILGIGGALGIAGYIFTLVRITTQSNRVVLEGVGATFALMAWLALSLFYAHAIPQHQVDDRVAAARVNVERQLDHWKFDDLYLAQFGQSGLSSDEVQTLVSRMDLTHQPLVAQQAVGYVVRPGNADGYDLIVLHWQPDGYYYSAEKASTQQAIAKVLAADK